MKRITMKRITMKRIVVRAVCGLLFGVLAAGELAQAQQPPGRQAQASPAQAALDQAAADGKFTFLVFYKDDSPPARAMVKVAKDGVAQRQDQATLSFVQVGNPAEKALVERFGVGRAPMPLTLAVAPNGAVTGIFSKELKDEHFDAAIVTPTMTRCMKSLQENKLVFVCVQPTDRAVVPTAVRDMQVDPQFKDRVVLVSMQMRDPQETRFLDQMQIDPKQVKATTAVLLAPPGVLIGKFDGTATKDQVAAALHKAGQCCDDPNCKHNHGAPQKAAQSNKAPSNNTRRN